MVLGQTVIYDDWGTAPTLPGIEPLKMPSISPYEYDIAPLQASQPTRFSPGESFAINAAGIGIAVLLGVLVMRGLRK